MPGHHKVRRLDFLLAIWFCVSMVFWLVYWAISKTLLPFVIYYPLWVALVGSLVWRNRAGMRSAFRSWRIGEASRFFVLGLAAVLSEEIIAALANHLIEGFSPLIFTVRIVQFWMLNIFTFFGFIVGWYVLLRFLVFSDREVFYLAGCWGLYAEKILFAIPVNPLFFVFDCVPTILTYGLIITPALLGLKPRPSRRRLHPLLRYPLAYLVIFVLSVPGILALGLLRTNFPSLFPPPSLVPP